jgi:DNA polymerase V
MQKQQIGKRHRKVREEVLKMSVSEYANLMRVKEVTVYSWESGRTSVPHAVMASLEEHHGVSAGWLITGDGPMMRPVPNQERPLPSAQDLERHVKTLQEMVDRLRTETPDVLAPARRHDRSKRVRIPLLSLAVSAGTPTASDDVIEREIDLADMLLEHPDSTYFIRVVGDSMTDAGISDGDTLIVDCAIPPRTGQVVIAKVFGELTVKRYLTDDGHPILRAENKKYKDIHITPDMEFTIVGVVRSCIKRF